MKAVLARIDATDAQTARLTAVIERPAGPTSSTRSLAVARHCYPCGLITLLSLFAESELSAAVGLIKSVAADTA